MAYCDMEGQGDQGVRYDIKLATPMLLLSQVLILMIVCPNGPERDSVLNDTLATLLDAARQLHTGEEQGDQQDTDKEKDRFGHLHLVLRDCIQSEEECDEIIFGEEDSAGAPDPESVEQRNRIRRDVLATFLSRRVWCLPQLLQPAATDHRQNQPPAWVHKMDELRNVVKAQCCVPKQFGGQPLKSELLPEIMEQLKEALNSSDHPALNPRSLVEQSKQILQQKANAEDGDGVISAAELTAYTEKVQEHAQQQHAQYAQQLELQYAQQYAQQAEAERLRAQLKLAQQQGYEVKDVKNRQEVEKLQAAKRMVHEAVEVAKLQDADEGVHVLVKMLEHSDEYVRTAAEEALSELSPEVLATHAAAMVAKLEDSNADVRSAVVKLLCKLPPEVLATYAEAVAAKLEDSDPGVQMAAVETLGQLPPEVLATCAEALVAKLEHSDEGVRCSAVETLGKLPPEVLATHAATVVAMLQHSDPSVQIAAVETLGKLPPEVLATYADAVVGMLEDSDEDVRCSAVETLGKLPPEVLATYAEALVAKLEHSDPGVQMAAVQTLGQLPPEVLATHTATVVAMLQHSDPDVRMAAVETLGTFEPGSLGSFELRVSSEEPFTLEPLQEEPAAGAVGAPPNQAGAASFLPKGSGPKGLCGPACGSAGPLKPCDGCGRCADSTAATASSQLATPSPVVTAREGQGLSAQQERDKEAMVAQAVAQCTASGRKYEDGAFLPGAAA